jgi:pimeloyl-ACP methyl ester carboxylesterase
MRRIGVSSMAGLLAIVQLAIASCATAPQSAEPRGATGGPSVGRSPTLTPPSAGTPSAAMRFPTSQLYEPPDPLPTGPMGSILRSEPLEARAGVRAWAILYLSTGLEGTPVAVSGIVLAPESAAPPDGRPVVAWAHGSRGVSDACAPSHDGASDLTTVTQPLLDLGYVVVATDYEGLGTPGPHPFLVGQSEGRSVLDGARAAQLVPDSGAGDRVAFVGHSQGGHAVLWAAELAPTYAPDLEVVGTVAAAPAGDLIAFATAIRRNGAPEIDWLIGLQIVSVWHELYGLPMDAVLSRQDQERAVQLPETCPDQSLIPSGQPLLADLTTIPEWRAQLEANTPGAAGIDDPILVLHGTADDIIPIETTESEVQRLCRAGDAVELRALEGADHGDSLYAGGRLTELAHWIAERLDGDPATSTCSP